MSLGVSSKFLQNNFKADKVNNSLTYEFEDFRLDAANLMLYRSGEVVALTPKQVETLAALVERGGEVVSKADLMDRLWADIAVEESNLSQNLYILRKKLGNRSDGKPLIETFRRRGYRFNGEIHESGEIELFVSTHTKTVTVTEETNEDLSIVDKVPTGNAKFTLLGHYYRNRGFFVAAAALIAGLAIIGFISFFRTMTGSASNRTAAIPVIKMTRLTPDQNVLSEAISPDSKYLAYDLIENGKHSLWLKDIASGSATQIMPADNSGHYDLQFSPDGTMIYYGTQLKDHPNFTTYRVPIFGGEPELVAYNKISPLTVSPDGKEIAFMRDVQGENQLIIAESDGSGERILSERSKTNGYETWGSNLSWSPDGLRIAVCGWKLVGGKRRYELIEVSLSDGSEQFIPTPDWNYLDDVVWFSDQSALIVRARETQVSPWQIWRVSYPDGKTIRVTNDLNDYDAPTLSVDSRTLVVSQSSGNFNLWTMPIDASSPARQLTHSTSVSANDGIYGIAVMPDGKIIYTSPRGGNVDLWEITADDSGQKQLTKNAGDFNGRPHVVPDGKSIVFVSTRSGSLQIWRMDEDGGNQRQLTFQNSVDHPWVSPDGAWIYFTSYDFHEQSIAKIPFNGGERITVFDQLNSYHPAISPNGELMYFYYYDENAEQPWKHGILSFENREMVKEFDPGERGFMCGWTADSSSVIVARDDPANIWVLPVDDGKPVQVTNFESGQIKNFALSPDSKQIVMSRGNPSAEAVQLIGF